MYSLLRKVQDRSGCYFRAPWRYQNLHNFRRAQNSKMNDLHCFSCGLKLVSCEMRSKPSPRPPQCHVIGGPLDKRKNTFFLIFEQIAMFASQIENDSRRAQVAGPGLAQGWPAGPETGLAQARPGLARWALPAAPGPILLKNTFYLVQKSFC